MFSGPRTIRNVIGTVIQSEGEKLIGINKYVISQINHNQTQSEMCSLH